jgi:signal transduction histidine kinase
MNQDDGSRFERLPPGHRHELPDAQRADPDRLSREIRSVSLSPVVTAVLEVADAVLLVLNPERQIVGFNSRVAEVKAPEDVLGLRPGEAFGCVNARGPAGCGASLACETCGALGAILGCQERGRPTESECLIRTDGAQGRMLEFNVRATPVTVEQTRFTVVSLRDISSEKRRQVLEQIFFHDVLNTVSGLRGWSYRLRRAGADVRGASERIDFLTGQLEREIRDHRALLFAESGTLAPERAPLRTGALLHDVASVFAGHSVARDRQLDVGPPADDVELVSDRSLLLRILINMVRNAFEASAAGGAVRLGCERDTLAVRLFVHNEGVIAPEVQARIFQRSFSTKAQRGRGLGTYSMKLFGERYLGGAVSFVSTAEAGTIFSMRLPVAPLPIAA